MFELPECSILTSQMNRTMKGKTIESGTLGNSPHKFVWYNVSHNEFSRIVKGKKTGNSHNRGRWMFIEVTPGYVMVVGECGGKILYHENSSTIPKKYHLLLKFTDGSAFSITTQMWGAMEIYKKGGEYSGKYVKDMKITPENKEFTMAYFNKLVDSCLESEVKSVKGILTQNQLIPGLGNSIAQDIMFKSMLNPKHPLKSLDKDQRKNLYNAIRSVVEEVASKGGRYDETDLYNMQGGYVRLMDKNSAGKPCPECGTFIEKIQYLGGACYYCPECQK